MGPPCCCRRSRYYLRIVGGVAMIMLCCWAGLATWKSLFPACPVPPRCGMVWMQRKLVAADYVAAVEKSATYKGEDRCGGLTPSLLLMYLSSSGITQCTISVGVGNVCL